MTGGSVIALRAERRGSSGLSASVEVHVDGGLNTSG